MICYGLYRKFIHPQAKSSPGNPNLRNSFWKAYGRIECGSWKGWWMKRRIYKTYPSSLNSLLEYFFENFLQLSIFIFRETILFNSFIYLISSAIRICIYDFPEVLLQDHLQIFSILIEIFISICHLAIAISIDHSSFPPHWMDNSLRVK